MDRYIIIESNNLSLTFSEKQFVKAVLSMSVSPMINLTLKTTGSPFYSEDIHPLFYDTQQDAKDSLRFLYSQLSDNVFTKDSRAIIPRKEIKHETNNKAAEVKTNKQESGTS